MLEKELESLLKIIKENEGNRVRISILTFISEVKFRILKDASIQGWKRLIDLLGEVEAFISKGFYKEEYPSPPFGESCTSNCCYSPFVENTDLCSSCKEHAIPFNSEEETMKSDIKIVIKPKGLSEHFDKNYNPISELAKITIRKEGK